MSDTKRRLEMEKAASDLAIKEARRLEQEVERLHIENLNLMRTIQQLRKALRGMIEAVEGDRMKNAIQRGKDVL